MDTYAKSQAVRKVMETLKGVDKRISYSQAVEILESTKEKLKSFQLFRN